MSEGTPLYSAEEHAAALEGVLDMLEEALQEMAQDPEVTADELDGAKIEFDILSELHRYMVASLDRIVIHRIQ